MLIIIKRNIQNLLKILKTQLTIIFLFWQAEEHAEVLSKDLEKTQSLLSDIEEEKKRLEVEATQVCS